MPSKGVARYNSYEKHQYMPPPPIKHTFYHATVQDYHADQHHFLVPLVSEQAENDYIKVGLARKIPDTSCSGKLTSTFHLPDKEAREELEYRKRNSKSTGMVSIGFSAAMKPICFSETVSVTDGPPKHDTSSVSFCDFEVDSRCKTEVNIGPGLDPTWFQSRIVCHETTTKKNFKTSVDYVPKMKPLKYGETQYVRPKHVVMTYVTYMDYNTNDSDRWYTSAIELIPCTNSHNTVHNFKLRQRSSSISSQDDADYDEVPPEYALTMVTPKTNGYMHSDEEGDINMNIVKDSITIKRIDPPTMLMSSGPDDPEDRSPERISHRTKVVVGRPPSQHMNDEDYVVYLQAYEGIGDKIEEKRWYAENGSLNNGYSSNDETDA